ncbi:MAG: CoA pyrophosphatase [Chloroflexi bacterium]|nr:CoA pyrophosphatase [Chloroflexota bacterium]
MDKLFKPFLDQLCIDLSNPLPGRDAQYRMAPAPRRGDDLYYDTPPTNARRSGVLVLFYPYFEQLHIPLILRPTYDGVHSGQVGFPGGGYEAGDLDISATALREAYEEVGIQSSQVTVLGQLSPLYVFASNNLVHPTVAWTAKRPIFHLDPREVDKLIEAPVLDLLNPANQRREEWQLWGRVAQVPFFRIQDQTIWGATAMMLSELFALPAFQSIKGGVQSLR